VLTCADSPRSADIAHIHRGISGAGERSLAKGLDGQVRAVRDDAIDTSTDKFLHLYWVVDCPNMNLNSVRVRMPDERLCEHLNSLVTAWNLQRIKPAEQSRHRRGEPGCTCRAKHCNRALTWRDSGGDFGAGC